MYPILFTIGGWSVPSYDVAMVLWMVVPLYLALRLNKSLPKPYPITAMAAVWGFGLGLLCSKLYFIIQYESIWYFYRALFFWKGGLVIYGGIIGGILGFSLYFRYKKVPVLAGLDIVFVYSPLGQAIGRVGCLMAGCCTGTRTDLPWGIRFPQSTNVFSDQYTAGLLDNEAMVSLPVHPTQLYAIFGKLLLFFFLRWMYDRKQHNGVVFLLYLTLYGGLRSVTESFRGDSVRSVFGVLTVSQAIGICAFVLGIITYFTLRATLWRDPVTNTNDADAGSTR